MKKIQKKSIYFSVLTPCKFNSFTKKKRSAHEEKSRGRKTRRIDKRSNSLSITIEFFIHVFILGANVLAYWFSGRGWGELLIFIWFCIEILKWLPSKQTHFRTHPARYEMGFGILSKFRSRTDLYKFQTKTSSHEISSSADTRPQYHGTGTRFMLTINLHFKKFKNRIYLAY